MAKQTFQISRYKCDRCSHVVEYSSDEIPGVNDAKKWGTLTTQNTNGGVVPGMDGRYTIDLCPGCVDRLTMWLRRFI